MTTLIETQNQVVAAFDFDGTITSRDTLLPFLIYAAGTGPTLRKISKLSPGFFGYLINLVSRQDIKEQVLTRFFSGMPMDQLQELGEAFAKSDILKKLVYGSALKRLEWHRRQKHRCVLVSASIDAYLEPWSKLYGFDDLVCSKMQVDTYGIVTGKLEGNNCWGAEKVVRLEELLGPREGYTLYAYGDSRGDRELLESADYAFYRKIPST